MDAMRLHSDSNAIKERKGKEKKEKEIVEDTPTPTEKSKFDIFNEWLKKTYPAVSKLKRQMTETELQTIIEKYGRTLKRHSNAKMENKGRPKQEIHIGLFNGQLANNRGRKGIVKLVKPCGCPIKPTHKFHRSIPPLGKCSIAAFVSLSANSPEYRRPYSSGL